ncbi:Ras-like protein Rab-23 [Saprolegnia diclina VS20]|uniref:Ras-like protein Rab-23 n=1 Tax=Saprolegnia diclina (strain VS20) TaxID=1156394 RepID=T0PY68_SAPDV|nr:Ras-like protein Rab-23 [Saprolegnia diclina VS20]EQC25990.1 Ras-like protein Rab-23 [Saprolegnia diclina VS20]|eukprot:XP_008620558.1 Ras-like protein Rab-23 [Saprolegnia diclina VS20]
MSDEMMDCDDFEKTVKVIVLGNGNVGKTSLTTQYAKGRFTSSYKKTIGVDFMERTVNVDGDDVQLMIWDTAGQEEFDALTSRYYKGAGAAVYVFSTTDRASFEALPSWQQKVFDECGRSLTQVLVQNKIDLIDDAAMTTDEVDAMKDRLRVRLFKTCVQANLNVETIFEHIVRRYLRKGQDHVAPVADIATLTSEVQQSSKKSIALQEAKTKETNNAKARHQMKPTTTMKKKSSEKLRMEEAEFDDITTADRAASEDNDDETPHAPVKAVVSDTNDPPRPLAPSKQRTNGKKTRAGCVVS